MNETEARAIDGRRARGNAEARVVESVEKEDAEERRVVRTPSLVRAASMFQRPIIDGRGLGEEIKSSRVHLEFYIIREILVPADPRAKSRSHDQLVHLQLFYLHK